MKIAILGFDREGMATYEYFSSPQANDDHKSHESYSGHIDHHGDIAITICDQNPAKAADIPEGVESRLGDTYLDNLDDFDLLIRTAGMPPQKILDKNPSIENTITAKITTGTNEFLSHCPTKNVIGVTGTKGKGTTSTLIANMLEAAGRTVHLGGNIGVPALSLIPNISPDDWVVLELSSFQLIDIKNSPHIGVCLMIAPEHQDWHGNVEEYYTAKEQLFARQTPGDVAIYYHDNPLSERIASAGMGQKIPFYHEPGAQVIDNTIVIEGKTICKTSELNIPGKHNWQNACAAVTAVWYALNLSNKDDDAASAAIQAMHKTLASFEGLEHRLELVREVNGVSYYDDSFGTTPETAIVAIEAFEAPKVVILGGSDKGADYNNLALTLKQNDIRKVLLIGEQAGRLRLALEKVDFDKFEPGGTTMAEIIANAQRLGKPGDVVLLSTACASFDMFKDYKDRGNQFKDAVAKL